MSNLHADLRKYWEFQYNLGSGSVVDASEGPRYQSGALLDYELTVSPRFPTTVLFTDLENLGEHGKDMVDYFLRDPSNSGDDHWIFGSPYRSPLFLTQGQYGHCSGLNPHVKRRFRTKTGEGHEHSRQIRVLSNIDSTSTSLLASMVDFVKRRSERETEHVADVGMEETKKEGPRMIRISIGESDPAKIPKLRLFISKNKRG